MTLMFGKEKQFGAAINFFNKSVFQYMRDDIDCWVAGGAVADYFRLKYVRHDIDVWFSNEIDYEEQVIHLIDTGHTIVYEDKRTTVFKIGKNLIQLIRHKLFNSPEDTIINFDFTVCAAAVDRKQVYYHEDFFIDLAGMRLQLIDVKYALSTMQRLQKYIKSGYTACNGTLLKLAEAIQKADLNNPATNVLMFDSNGNPRFVYID